MSPKRGDFNESTQVLRGRPHPGVKVAPPDFIDVAATEFDEPARGFFVDLAVQSISRNRSRKRANALTRYFFAIGREIPSRSLIWSMDKPSLR